MTSSGPFDLPDFDDHSRARAVVRGAVDMLAAIAVNLGYHPGDQIVVASVMHGILGPMVAEPLLAATATREQVDEQLATMVRHVRRAGATRFFVAGYGHAAAVDPSARAAVAALGRAGADVLDVGRVTGNRYFSYVCADPGCCPLEGVEVDVNTSSVMLSAVLRGVVTAPSRVRAVRKVVLAVQLWWARGERVDACVGLFAGFWAPVRSSRNGW